MISSKEEQIFVSMFKLFFLISFSKQLESPITNNEKLPYKFSSTNDLTITSGPMPAGSPIVIPIIGNDICFPI